nr:uncharacterized protein LOC109185225 [Ipomoea trifida]
MITLWDEHVNSVLPFYNAVLTDPLIVILQLCRARVTDGKDFQFLHYNEGFVQLRMPEFFTFKGRFFTPIRSISSSSRITGFGSLEAMLDKNITVISWKDIHDNKKAGEFWVVGEIIDIERDWYFIAGKIKGCGNKLQDYMDKMYCKGCMPNEIDGLVGKTLKFRIVTRHDQFNYRGNVAFTVLGVKNDEAIAKSVKKGEEGSVVRKLADAK